MTQATPELVPVPENGYVIGQRFAAKALGVGGRKLKNFINEGRLHPAKRPGHGRFDCFQATELRTIADGLGRDLAQLPPAMVSSPGRPHTPPPAETQHAGTDSRRSGDDLPTEPTRCSVGRRPGEEYPDETDDDDQDDPETDDDGPIMAIAVDHEREDGRLELRFLALVRREDVTERLLSLPPGEYVIGRIGSSGTLEETRTIRTGGPGTMPERRSAPAPMPPSVGSLAPVAATGAPQTPHFQSDPITAAIAMLFEKGMGALMSILPNIISKPQDAADIISRYDDIYRKGLERGQSVAGDLGDVGDVAGPNAWSFAAEAVKVLAPTINSLTSAALVRMAQHGNNGAAEHPGDPATPGGCDPETVAGQDSLT